MKQQIFRNMSFRNKSQNAEVTLNSMKEMNTPCSIPHLTEKHSAKILPTYFQQVLNANNMFWLSALLIRKVFEKKTVSVQVKGSFKRLEIFVSNGRRQNNATWSDHEALLKRRSRSPNPKSHIAFFNIIYIY